MGTTLKKAVVTGTIVASSALAVFGASNLAIDLLNEPKELNIADISIPSEINLTMRDGVLTNASSNTTIDNNSDFNINIKDIRVSGRNDWVVVDYNDDFSIKSDDTKEVALLFNNDYTLDGGKVSLTDGEWIIPRDGEKALQVGVKIPYQSLNSPKTNIAVIEYRVEIQKHLITLVAGEHGDINGDTTFKINDGSILSLPEVIPDDGYKLEKWINTETGEEVTEDIEVRGPVSLTALFRTVNSILEFTPSVGGSLQGNTTIEVAPNGTITQFPTPVPDDGYEFDKWVDVSTGTEITSDTVITSDMNITAQFKLSKAIVTFIAGENGVITGNTTLEIEKGNTISKFPTPQANLGFEFDKWINADTGETITSSTVINSNITVQAIFKSAEGYLSSSSLKSIAKSLTGSITFSDERYTGTGAIDVSKEQNGSILAVIDGQNIKVYSDGGVKVTDTAGLFQSYKATSIDCTGLDTSEATSLYFMFSYNSKLTSVNISALNTSNVIDIEGIFAGCSALTSINISGIDISNVETMGSAFEGCSSLTTLNLSGLDTSSATDMSAMFSGCSKLKAINMNFTTSNVTNMRTMFQGCTSLTTLSLTSFDTSKVTNTYYMFATCTSLTYLDLSSFNTSKITNCSEMLWNLPSNAKVYVSSSTYSWWNSNKTTLDYKGTFTIK